MPGLSSASIWERHIFASWPISTTFLFAELPNDGDLSTLSTPGSSVTYQNRLDHSLHPCKLGGGANPSALHPNTVSRHPSFELFGIRQLIEFLGPTIRARETHGAFASFPQSAGLRKSYSPTMDSLFGSEVAFVSSLL